MNKIRKALLISVLVSLIFTVTGCQEDQACATDSIDKQGVKSAGAVEIKPPAKKTGTVTPANPKIVKVADDMTKAQNVSSVLKFDKLEHDFGVVGPNVYVNCEFKFTNISGKTLKFPRLPKAGCGCTVPKLDKMEYAAGESGVIKVRYHSNATPANVRKHITVFTGDADEATIELTIKAKIELAIVTTPKSLNLSLTKDNAGIKPIVITSKDGKAFAIKSYVSTSNIFSFDFDKTKKAIKHTIMPKVDMEKLKKRLTGNISINLDHPNTNQVVLRYNTPPMWKVTSPHIFLINPDPSKPETRDIKVMSNYGEQVEIESIVSAKKCIKVLSQEKMGKSVKLVVEVTPKRPQQNLRSFYDSLIIKLKGGDTLRINATGTFKRKTVPASNTVKSSK